VARNTMFAVACLRGRFGSVAAFLCVLLLPAWATGQPPDGPAQEQPGAPAPFRPQFRPTLEIHPASGPIEIDGEIEDLGWRDAARATGFAEVSPGDQIAPPYQTEAWVTYDEKNFYVALVAEDDPRAVRVSLRNRDDIWNDDYYGFLLDTYGDLNWGYEFFTNPLGIQGDLRLHSGGEEDLSYDLIWHSRGKVTARGYQIEIAVPFASLRFPAGEAQTWRINFWRDQQRDVRRRMAWAATNRDEACFMCQWGTLTGIRGIHPSRSLELIVSAIGTQSGEAGEESAAERRLDYSDPEGEAALSARYALSSTSSTEVTVNPDFSQIESDAGQIDINEPFTIYYEEKRPFFLEGSEQYRTLLQAVYTRSISNPRAAGKLLGSHGRASLAWTLAWDEDSPVILPLEERSFYRNAGTSRVNLLRAQRAFGTDSHLGWLLTDRRFEAGGGGTLSGFDGSARFLRNWRLRAQALASRFDEPPDMAGMPDLPALTFDHDRHTLAFDGERLAGHAVKAILERSGRVWNSSIEFDERHPSFRADNGYISRNDYRLLDLWNGFTFQPNGSVIVSWQPSMMVARMWDYAGRFQDEWAMLELEGEFKQQTSIGVEGLISRERFREKLFPGIRRMTLEASTRPSETIGLEAGVEFGRSIYRTFAPDVEPYLGRFFEFGLDASLKFHSQVTLTTGLSYERMKEPEGERLAYEGWILRNRLNLQVTREASLRIVTEYDDFAEVFAFEPLLTYRLNAFSVFYLGMSDQYLRLREMAGRERTGDRDWRIDRRQIFAKIQYLLRV